MIEWLLFIFTWMCVWALMGWIPMKLIENYLGFSSNRQEIFVSALLGPLVWFAYFEVRQR